MFPFQPSRHRPASRRRPRSTEPKEIEDWRTFSDSKRLIPLRESYPAKRDCFTLLLTAFSPFSSHWLLRQLPGDVALRGHPSSRPPLYSDILMQCRLSSPWCPQGRVKVRKIRNFPPRAKAPVPTSRRCDAGDGYRDRPARSRPGRGGDPTARTDRRPRQRLSPRR